MKMNDWKVQIRISGAIERWMIKNGLTIAEAAKKTGIYYDKMSYLERGLAYPSLAELIVLADELGVTTDYLLCREKDR